MNKKLYITAEFEFIGLHNTNVISTSSSNENFDDGDFDWGGSSNESYEEEDFDWGGSSNEGYEEGGSGW